MHIFCSVVSFAWMAVELTLCVCSACIILAYGVGAYVLIDYYHTSSWELLLCPLCRCRHRPKLYIIYSHWLDFRPAHFGLTLGKTVNSILPQSTQLQNGYLAKIRQCLELVRYMLPVALEYPLWD